MGPYLLSALGLIAAVSTMRADRMPDYTPLVRVAQSEIAVIGKVTSIEKETVAATSYPQATAKTEYTIATVKVETNIRGAKAVTHLKVGFYPGSSGTGGSYKFPVLKDGQEVCVFLNKHYEAGFYVFPSLAPPLDVNETNKETLAKLKRAATVFQDPALALKAEQADDRLLAAAVLMLQYRTPIRGKPNATEPVALEESQAILKILAEADWTNKSDPELAAKQAFLQAGILEHPKFAKIRPNPGDDLNALWKAELQSWLKTDGKEYRIQKFVPKAK